MSRSPQFRDRPLMKLMFCFSAPLCLTVDIQACLRFNFSSHHHSDFSYPSECLFFSSFLLNLLCCKRRVLVPPPCEVLDLSSGSGAKSQTTLLSQGLEDYATTGAAFLKCVDMYCCAASPTLEKKYFAFSFMNMDLFFSCHSPRP